jgi:hypothetical protein
MNVNLIIEVDRPKPNQAMSHIVQGPPGGPDIIICPDSDVDLSPRNNLESTSVVLRRQI